MKNSKGQLKGDQEGNFCNFCNIILLSKLYEKRQNINLTANVLQYIHRGASANLTWSFELGSVLVQHEVSWFETDCTIAWQRNRIFHAHSLCKWSDYQFGCFDGGNLPEL